MTVLARTPQGEIAVPPAVLAQLVARAAESVDGVRVRRPRRGVSVELAGGGCRVSVALSARQGMQLPELGEAVQERIAEVVEGMLELEPRTVDVAIEEIDA